MTKCNQRFSLRMNKALYEQIRRIAFEGKTTMNECLIQLIEKGLFQTENLQKNGTEFWRNDDYSNESENRMNEVIQPWVQTYEELGLIAILRVKPWLDEYILIFEKESPSLDHLTKMMPPHSPPVSLMNLQKEAQLIKLLASQAILEWQSNSLAENQLKSLLPHLF